MARCPECHAKLVMSPNFALWDHFFCTECEAELEVVDLDPLELEVVHDVSNEEEEEEDLEDLEEEEEEVLDWEDEEEW
ncbi:MAG: hypothetical protein JXA33_21235 [Anaerolineae bacterium]|nr:hypothetical protein [Anaerolineae bacterium]